LSGDWRTELEQQLLGAANAAGAWGYSAESVGAAEPTALAAMALSGRDALAEPVERGLAWVTQLQGADGAVPVSAAAPGPYWPTSLALLGWCAGDEALRARFTGPMDAATRWLLDARGKAVSQKHSFFDHDAMLTGWPWVAGTHSWLEPTGYAVLALRARGEGAHPRTREAVKLMLNRALPDGGWNYGNRRVFGKALRAFPATTGVALAALSGEPRSAEVDAGIRCLVDALPRISAPLSLAWGLIGLQAWDAMPGDAELSLARSAKRLAARPVNPHYIAMLLIAGAGGVSFVLRGKERTRGR
jgi:hypothetical protein